MNTENTNELEQDSSPADGKSVLNAGLGWRCSDCCGTGFHYFSHFESEECGTCGGTGKEGLTPRTLTGNNVA